MLFKINNSRHVSCEQLYNNTLMSAYYIIKNYPMHATDLVMNQFIQQQYNTSLKNMCIKLLLELTFYKNSSGDLILLFKDPKYDIIASLITYGNGAIFGSKILQCALKT